MQKYDYCTFVSFPHRLKTMIAQTGGFSDHGCTFPVPSSSGIIHPCIGLLMFLTETSFP